MGKNDILMKKWISDKERFADLFNGGLFGGKQVIDPEYLEPDEIQQELLVPDNQNQVTPIRRYHDVVMKSEQNLKLLVLACENQQNVHYGMAVRGMLYDALSYTEQVRKLSLRNRKEKKTVKSAEFLSGIVKEDKLLPVLTVVFYYGGEGEWDGSKDLHGMMAWGRDEDILKPYIPNYCINLIDAGEVKNPENFKSDLQYIFGMLQYKKDKNKLWDYIHEHERFFSGLPEDTYEVARVLLKSEWRLEKPEEDVLTGGINMCKALEDLYNDGVAEGREKGRAEGRKRAFLEMVRDGLITLQMAAEKLGVTEEELKCSVSKE